MYTISKEVFINSFTKRILAQAETQLIDSLERIFLIAKKIYIVIIINFRININYKYTNILYTIKKILKDNIAHKISFLQIPQISFFIELYTLVNWDSKNPN